jgi:hypothetical protein
MARTPASAGNRRTFTQRMLVKGCDLATQHVWCFAIDGAYSQYIMGNLSGSGGVRLSVFQWNGVGVLYNHVSDAWVVDPTAWYDIVVAVDTTQAGAADRVKMYVNGAQVPTSSPVTGQYAGAIPQNFECRWNATVAHEFADDVSNASAYFADVHAVDGQALTPDAFGEWSDRVTGLWMPKIYEGTYGTNGFRLDFANAADLGADVSGNANHWTVTGSPEQTLDTPTNNHCTLHPLDPATTGTLSGGNLTVAGGNATVTLRPETGKWSYRKDGAEQLYDADVSGPFNPVLTAGSYDFGASGYTPAAGYRTLCAANLPEPSVFRSDTVADIVLREGTGAAVDITSLGFAPDWVVVKGRDTVGGPQWGLTDTVRGANKQVYFNRSDVAEVNQLECLTAFGGSGYTLGTNVQYNMAGANFIDLCGLEIVTYTGTGATQNIAHSLGKAPAFMIVRNRSAASNWVVYHTALGATKALFFTTNAAFTDASYWNNTEPTAAQFTVGTYIGTNTSGHEYVAYLFTDSDVFRAFSYTGNASTDGPFVHLGGRALSVPFLKNTGAGSTSWYTFDAMRDQFNPIAQYLQPDTTNVEGTSQWATFTATGAKVIGSGVGYNGSGNLFVGLAILQSTKYANAF